MPQKYFQQPPVQSALSRFSSTPAAEIQRSRFDRSHGHKTTLDAGELVPIFVDEVLPGDTFDMKHTAFARMATPLRPVMDNIYYDTQFFFVPNRLIWDDWQAFCGERASPTDDPSTLTVPTITIDLATVAENSIAAYMGIPLGKTGQVTVSALPARAYFLIYNEWYRDQNLIAELPVITDSTPVVPPNDLLAMGPCQRRGKRHDYFTSCLPWPQKGDPVLIPVDGLPLRPAANAAIHFKYSGGPGAGTPMQVNASGDVVWGDTGPGGNANVLWVDPNLEIDALNGVGATINDLRSAFQIQRLLERDARGGTRYREILLSHFGVVSPDASLQRPEYLGGSSTRVNINPVAATFHNVEVAQGELAGVGTVVSRSGFRKSFTEHGWIIGMASVRADMTYQQGLDRMWSRQTRYDFYWPALAHLGEQAVLEKEIFLQPTVAGQDDLVFGYQERYAEYRFKLSRITGEFSSGASSSLDMWHVGQEYANAPLLNKEFIEENPPLDRIMAVPTEPHFLVDTWFDLKCDRPIPVYGVPGMADHF